MWENGGIAFLIPFIICLVAFAIPMFYLETAFGQLIRCKVHQRFTMIHPRMWGFGLTQVTMSIVTIYYYIHLIPWVISFLFDSFKDPLPWTEV